jgi:hypothetical protein
MMIPVLNLTRQSRARSPKERSLVLSGRRQQQQPPPQVEVASNRDRVVQLNVYVWLLRLRWARRRTSLTASPRSFLPHHVQLLYKKLQMAI